MRRHVYFYTYLDHDFAGLQRVLAGDPARWLPVPAAPDDDGWVVDLNARGVLPAALAQHTARVRVGAAGPGGHGPALLRSVSWQSTTAERLLPVLEGDLELTSLDGCGCQLSMMGSYRPPLSVVGEAGDRLLGHRLAEACVRRFVLDVGARLEESATLPA